MMYMTFFRECLKLWKWYQQIQARGCCIVMYMTIWKEEWKRDTLYMKIQPGVSFVKWPFTYYVTQRGWGVFRFLVTKCDAGCLWSVKSHFLSNSTFGTFGLFYNKFDPKSKKVWQSYFDAFSAVSTVAVTVTVHENMAASMTTWLPPCTVHKQHNKHIISTAEKYPTEIHNVTPHIWDA